MKQNRSSSSSSSSPPLPILPLPPSPPPKKQRELKPYDDLKPTQQRERRKRMREAVAAEEKAVGCPVTAVVDPPSPSPSSLLHLSTSDRDRIRSVDAITIPSEKKMRAMKEQLTHTHNTTTTSFPNGAYISDPISFVSTITSSSSFICVGGDAGGGYTKVGISFFF
jgi:hypothetical protein